MFFLNKEVKEILWKNPEVLLMDCTYKTNRYRMPLLVIAGHTSIGTTFIVALAFLSGEDAEDYKWVLEQVKKVYFSLALDDPIAIVTDREKGLIKAINDIYPQSHHCLCVWHVKMNVKRNCRASFESEDAYEEFLEAWKKVIYAFTKDACIDAWNELAAKYDNEAHGGDVAYL